MDDDQLVKAIATQLAAAAVGQYRPAGPIYTALEVGIYYGTIAPTPDSGIGVALYATGDDVQVGTGTRWVQVRSRGAKNVSDAADALAAAAFRALHDTYPGGGIARIVRVSTARLGADGNGRQERTDNYQVILDNPEATP